MLFYYYIIHIFMRHKNEAYFISIIYIYVTVNMCNQGIRVFPENFREYVHSLVLMTREYAYSLTINC